METHRSTYQLKQSKCLTLVNSGMTFDLTPAVMVRMIPVVIVLMLGWFSAPAQDTIKWSPETLLTWDDFKGEPGSDEFGAVSSVGHCWNVDFLGLGNVDFVEVTVQAYFMKSKSWRHPEKCTDVLLAHEQLHFDIAELYARKLRKRLTEELEYGSQQEVNARVLQIVDEVEREREATQDLYDAESDHSRDEEGQAKWVEKIALELQELEDYTDTKFTLSL